MLTVWTAVILSVILVEGGMGLNLGLKPTKYCSNTTNFHQYRFACVCPQTP